MTWEKKAPVEHPGFQSGCLNCGPTPIELPLEADLCVGFGECSVTRDGVDVYKEEALADEDADAPLLKQFEDMAKADPDHDWRVRFSRAMSEEVYQRHGDGRWVLIEKGMGFA